MLCQFLKAKLQTKGFRRFTKADLVGNNYPVPFFRQAFRGFLPVSSVKVFAMHQQNHFSVWLRGPNIHIGHLQIVALTVKRYLMNLKGIFITTQHDIKNRSVLSFQPKAEQKENSERKKFRHDGSI